MSENTKKTQTLFEELMAQNQSLFETSKMLQRQEEELREERLRLEAENQHTKTVLELTNTELELIQLDGLERSLVSVRTELLAMGRKAQSLAVGEDGDLGGTLMSICYVATRVAQELGDELTLLQKSRTVPPPKKPR
jgi:hypothetical protein